MSHVLMKHAARNNNSLLTVEYFRSLQAWECFLAPAWFGEWRQTLDERQAPSAEHVRGTNSSAAFPCSFSESLRGLDLCKLGSHVRRQSYIWLGALSCEDRWAPEVITIIGLVVTKFAGSNPAEAVSPMSQICGM
jgi:hypothetical protein